MSEPLPHQRRFHMRAMSVLLVAVCTCAPAWAGIAEDCASPDPDLSVKGCSIIIETGPTPQVDTAMAYSNRGRAHMLLGQFERAFADLDEALPPRATVRRCL